MKKYLLIAIFLLVILAVVSAIIFHNQKPTGSTNDADNNKLIEVVKAEVAAYCNNLSSVATTKYDGGDYCPRPTCKGEPVLNITKVNDQFNAKADIDLIYKWRNDMPGSNHLLFVLDSRGNIIERNIPDANNAGCN